MADNYHHTDLSHKSDRLAVGLFLIHLFTFRISFLFKINKINKFQCFRSSLQGKRVSISDPLYTYTNLYRLTWNLALSWQNKNKSQKKETKIVISNDYYFVVFAFIYISLGCAQLNVYDKQFKNSTRISMAKCVFTYMDIHQWMLIFLKLFFLKQKKVL